jgi:hypothetical protein
MHKLFAIILVCAAASLHGLNVVTLWSLGDVGAEYTASPEDSPVPESMGFTANILKFNWLDTDSGIGISFTMTAYHQAEGEISWPLPPIELMWNPLTVKTPVGYLNWGIYNRTALFSESFSIGRLTNSTGTRFIFSSHPFGKTESPHRGNYHVNRVLFLEYLIDDVFGSEPSSGRFRIGFTVDIGILFTSLLTGTAHLAAWPFSNSEMRKGR